MTVIFVKKTNQSKKTWSRSEGIRFDNFLKRYFGTYLIEAYHKLSRRPQSIELAVS